MATAPPVVMMRTLPKGVYPLTWLETMRVGVCASTAPTTLLELTVNSVHLGIGVQATLILTILMAAGVSVV